MFRPASPNRAKKCYAILAIIFIAFFTILVSIIWITYLITNPKPPVFDITHANQSSLRFSAPEQFEGGEFVILASISNPNKNIHVKFDHAFMELLFEDTVIGNHSIQAFSVRPKETVAVVIKYPSVSAQFTEKLSIELKREVMSDLIFYNVRLTFKIRSRIGVAHFTNWVHQRCYLRMTGPPMSSLTDRMCRT